MAEFAKKKLHLDTGLGDDGRRMEEMCVLDLFSHQQTEYSSQMKEDVFPSEEGDGPKEEGKCRSPERQSTHVSYIHMTNVFKCDKICLK